MKFEQFEARLNDLLDQRLSWDADPEVAQLIHDSPEHRALAAAYGVAVDRQTLSKIDPVPRSISPRDLMVRVLAELQTSEAASPAPDLQTRLTAVADEQPTTQGWLAISLAIAATLLLAVGLAALRPESAPNGSDIARATPRPANPLAAVDVPAPTPEVSPSELAAPRIIPEAQTPADESNAAAPSAAVANGSPSQNATIGSLVNEARDKYADLARDTQQAVSEVAMLLPGFGPTSAARRNESNRGEDAQARDDDRSGAWAGEVGEGLEPLTRSTVGALDFILQALPVENRDPQS